MLSLIVSISFALLVDKFGRRPIFLLSTGSMFVTFIFWTLTCALYEEYQSPGANYGMIFFIWVFNIAYAIAWSGLLISYAVEILPYTLRAKGSMVLNVSIQSALTLNNYANPVALDYFKGETWKLYLIYTVSSACQYICDEVADQRHSAGSSSSSASSTSNTSRPRDPPSRNWPRSLTAIMLRWPSWISSRWRRSSRFATGVTASTLMACPN